ncbi:MAG: metallophosphoesterase family protein [Akkermansiaceae bacterium]|nr:metallophosphoesterase family protein [Akkermansiaceae bacterium]
MSLILDIDPPPGTLVRFLSDLHLAHKRGRTPSPEALIAEMEGVDILVLCGDTAETRETCLEREHSIRLREKLRELCRLRGIRLIELAGNHDPDIEPMLLRLWGGRVVAMHGHAILKEISPWSREYMSARDEVKRIIAAHPEAETHLETRLELARSVTRELSRRVPQPTARKTPQSKLLRDLHHCFWPPLRPLHIITAWLRCGARAERWIRRYLPDTEIFIIGHFHRSGRWQYGRRTILNTGAWFELATPYAVDVKDAKLLSYHPLTCSRNYTTDTPAP